MLYSIDPVSTVYAEVRFRSRLEARWAAFFDLCEIDWDYKPFDLRGWTPDFLLTNLAGVNSALVDVCPIDINVEGHYDVLCRHRGAAFRHALDHVVVVCGIAPNYDFAVQTDRLDRPKLTRIGVVLERHRFDDPASWHCVLLRSLVARRNWHQAGSIVRRKA